MTKTRKRRSAREAAAAAARARAWTSRDDAASLLSAIDQYSALLDGLLSIETSSVFVDAELLGPRSVWLVIDLALVLGVASQSLEKRLDEVLNALSQLCVDAETLRPWSDLYSVFWTRVLESEMVQRSVQGDKWEPSVFQQHYPEEIPSMADIIQHMRARGVQVALRWRDRRFNARQAVGPMARFLAKTVDRPLGSLIPITIALRVEASDVRAEDIVRIHSVLVMDPSPVNSRRLCESATLRQLSFASTTLTTDSLDALTELLNDPLLRRVDELVLNDTTPRESDASLAFPAAPFRQMLSAAVRLKSTNGQHDPGISLSLASCTTFNTTVLDALHTALFQATRPIRVLSIADLWLRGDAMVRSFARVVVTPYPAFTDDFELNAGGLTYFGEEERIVEALYDSLAATVTEAISRVRAALTARDKPVTCRPLYADRVFEDHGLRHPIDIACSTAAYYQVQSVALNGSIQIVVPAADHAEEPTLGWLGCASIASIRVGETTVVGARVSGLILDGEHHRQFVAGLLGIAGTNLTRLSMRHHTTILYSLPAYLVHCTTNLRELNLWGGCSGSGYQSKWSTKLDAISSSLEILNMASCSVDAEVLKSLPAFPRLRYFQLADNAIGAEGLELLLARLRSRDSHLSYLNVHHDGFDSTDERYAKVQAAVKTYLREQELSTAAKSAFLSVLPHVERQFALRESISIDIIVMIFAFASSPIPRTIVW